MSRIVEVATKVVVKLDIESYVEIGLQDIFGATSCFNLRVKF